MNPHPYARRLVPWLLAACAAATLALIARQASRPVGNQLVPLPAKPVYCGRYLGRWYVLAGDPNRFERACEGAMADYALDPRGLIGVRNTCLDSDGRTRRVAKGRARVVPDSGNARLKVSFFGPFFFGDYWILDHADDYDWSIVGEPRGRYLWLLVRTPTSDDDRYARLLDRVARMGYDTSLIRRTTLQLPPAPAD
jgi:apolipoprotein D and lipocalin family protein